MTQKKTNSRRRSEPKLFRCTGFGDCDMVFTRSEHLARHARKHTGEKPFQCVVPNCGKMFSRLDNMIQHTQTHNRQKMKGPDTKSNKQLKKTHSNQMRSLETEPNENTSRHSFYGCSPAFNDRQAINLIDPIAYPPSPIKSQHDDYYDSYSGQYQLHSPHYSSIVSPVTDYFGEGHSVDDQQDGQREESSSDDHSSYKEVKFTQVPNNHITYKNDTSSSTTTFPIHQNLTSNEIEAAEGLIQFCSEPVVLKPLSIGTGATSLPPLRSIAATLSNNLLGSKLYAFQQQVSYANESFQRSTY